MKMIKRYYRILKRYCRRAKTQSNHEGYLSDISEILKVQTIQDLDLSVGYYIGIVTKAEEFGEITAGQKEELIQIVRYIYTGELEKRNNA